MKLMIVESPTKAKKIGSILGAGWRVEASMGHITEMPVREIGVEPPNYRVTYLLNKTGKGVVAKLKALAASASEIYLATDPDREGEAISAHLKHHLRINRYFRVTYNEVTEAGLRTALAARRQIDDKLVQAQEARRAADRLIGYRVSFPLREATGMPVSAGRCQTPAVRLVVERQREIDSFKVTDHFGARVLFDNGAWSAEWQTKPYLSGDSEYILDQALAERAAACRSFTVTASNRKPVAVAPGAPFTTSALLQAAGASLRMPPGVTQKAAQSLFENGHITYHRTDNPNLSDEGAAAIAAFAQSQGWAVSQKRRRWKLPPGAQEAHEAIRPTHPEALEAGDSEAERALYKLIWRRAVASQLADAIYSRTTLDLVSRDGGGEFAFRASAAQLVTPGWKIVSTATDKDDDDTDEEASSGKVPLLDVGTNVRASDGELLRKATKPPSRYTETSLIKKLEALGIGRPATYAAILQNICGKGYVKVEKRYLVPALEGYAIVDHVVNRFAFGEYTYTKDLESRLDDIAEGRAAYLPVISDIDRTLGTELSRLGQLAAQRPQFPCPQCGKPMRRAQSKKTRRYFWGCSAYREGCPVLCEDTDGQPGAVIVRNDNPSEKQVEFARAIAERNGLAIPEEVLASAKALSAWLDEAKASEGPRPASDKQKELIAKIITEKGVEPPQGWPDSITMHTANAFLNGHLGGGRSSKAPAKRSGTPRKKATSGGRR